MTAFTTMRRILLANLLGALCALPAFAQQVTWSEPGPLGAGQRATLDLVFDETQPAGAVHLPTIDGLTVVGRPSESSRVSIVNGQRSTSVTLSYPVRGEREGRVEVPAFDVSTIDGQRTVPAITVEVGPAMLSGDGHQGGTAVNNAVSARMLPSTKQPYAGEVFNVDVVVGLHHGRRGEVIGTPEWNSKGVETEGWGKGAQMSTADGSGVRFRTRAVVPNPGAITVAPAQQDVRVEDERSRRADDFFSMPDFALSGLSDFFSRSSMREATVATDAVELNVRPLPQPAPSGFGGAVGDFTLESKIVPEQPKAGEPVTWTLTLKGTGNWGEVQLPARAVPSDMRTLQPKQHHEFNENSLFTGSVSEDLVLIPSRAGELHLEPVHFVYFNPKTQRYDTASVQPPTLTVEPGALPLQQQASAPQAVAAPAPGAQVAQAPPPMTQPAAALPHDPLSGTSKALSPLDGRSVFAWCAVPFAALAIYWLSLAVRRARQTDPRRRQREAFAQLRAAIASAQRAADLEQRRAALLAWQHAAAVVLGIPVAAPTAAHVRALRDDKWVEAWAATERVLYGRDATLEAWWYDQASRLCAHIRLPRVNPLRAFLPHNLLPLTSAVTLLVVCALAAHAEPLDEYRQGNFAAAQQQFATQAAAAPTNWIARYNLGLTAAQLGENGRALGETAAAFALHPQSEAVRWNLGIVATRLPGVDPTLTHVMFAPGLAALARFASPATWQVVSFAACILLCAGGALTLHNRYQGRARMTRARAAVGLLVGGMSGLSVALLALGQYGPLANPTTAVVAQATTLRSVPTEADSTQPQTPLAAGSVVTMQKDFLGWVRVTRANGETGWLRGSELVPLYGPPSAV